MANTLMSTNFQLPDQVDFYKGKVREVYTLSSGKIIIVATDRLSAFDVVLPQGIPYKGQILNEIVEGEKIQVVNNSNGERLETYAIPGARGRGEIILNGAAARKVAPGDILILMAYAIMTPEEAKTFQPKLVFPNENNLLN